MTITDEIDGGNRDLLSASDTDGGPPPQYNTSRYIVGRRLRAAFEAGAKPHTDDSRRAPNDDRRTVAAVLRAASARRLGGGR